MFRAVRRRLDSLVVVGFDNILRLEHQRRLYMCFLVGIGFIHVGYMLAVSDYASSE